MATTRIDIAPLAEDGSACEAPLPSRSFQDLRRLSRARGQMRATRGRSDAKTDLNCRPAGRLCGGVELRDLAQEHRNCQASASGLAFEQLFVTLPCAPSHFNFATLPFLRQQLVHYFPVHIRQPEIPPLEAVRQLRVIESEQMQDGRL